MPMLSGNLPLIGRNDEAITYLNLKDTLFFYYGYPFWIIDIQFVINILPISCHSSRLGLVK